VNRVEALLRGEDVDVAGDTHEAVECSSHTADERVRNLFFLEACGQTVHRLMDVVFFAKESTRVLENLFDGPAEYDAATNSSYLGVPKTTAPPTTVIRTFVRSSSAGGIAKKSPSTIVKSASLPGSIVPRLPSSNAA
jgi:hypothetical protein